MAEGLSRLLERLLPGGRVKYRGLSTAAAKAPPSVEMTFFVAVLPGRDDVLWRVGGSKSRFLRFAAEWKGEKVEWEARK